MSRPSTRKKKEGGEGEESELLQNSSDEEAGEDGEFLSVSSSPPMKPLITDRQVGSGSQRRRGQGHVNPGLCSARLSGISPHYS